MRQSHCVKGTSPNMPCKHELDGQNPNSWPLQPCCFVSSLSTPVYCALCAPVQWPPSNTQILFGLYEVRILMRHGAMANMTQEIYTSLCKIITGNSWGAVGIWRYCGVVATERTSGVIVLHRHALTGTVPEKECVGLCISLLKLECRLNNI